MYEVLSFLHVKVLAMSESGNIARKGSAISLFPLYDSHGIQHPRVGVWRFFSVEVDPKPLCVALDAGKTVSRAVLGPGNVSDGAEQNLHPLQTFYSNFMPF